MGGLGVDGMTPTVAPYGDLTPREREIAQLLIDGWGRREIAAQLGLQPNAVKFHLANLKLKIPGDRPLAQRLVLWAAGFEAEMLFRPPSLPVR